MLIRDEGVSELSVLYHHGMQRWLMVRPPSHLHEALRSTNQLPRGPDTLLARAVVNPQVTMPLFTSSVLLWTAPSLVGPWERHLAYKMPPPYDDIDKYRCATATHPP